MIPWINQHLVEGKEAIHSWRINRNVSVLATVDHVEVASRHFILGLNIGWENRTLDPITVVEIQVILYKQKEDDVLVRLLPLERFARPDMHRKSFVKKSLKQFVLPPKAIHTENLRFLSHQHIDLQPGSYTTEIQVRDTKHHSYTRRTKILLESQMKYRVADDWRETTA